MRSITLFILLSLNSAFAGEYFGFAGTSPWGQAILSPLPSEGAWPFQLVISCDVPDLPTRDSCVQALRLSAALRTVESDQLELIWQVSHPGSERVLNQDPSDCYRRSRALVVQCLDNPASQVEGFIEKARRFIDYTQRMDQLETRFLTSDAARSSTHKMSFMVTDDVVTGKKYSQIEDLLGMPVVNSPSGPRVIAPPTSDGWIQAAQENNWKYVIYYSQPLSGSGKSAKRIMVHMPRGTLANPQAEKWFAGSLDGESLGEDTPLGVITTLPSELDNEVSSSDGPRAKIYFRDYGIAQGSQNYEFRANQSSCTKCHMGGLRSFHLTDGTVFASNWDVSGSPPTRTKGIENSINNAIRNSNLLTKRYFDDTMIARQTLGPEKGKGNLGCVECHSKSSLLPELNRFIDWTGPGSLANIHLGGFMPPIERRTRYEDLPEVFSVLNNLVPEQQEKFLKVITQWQDDDGHRVRWDEAQGPRSERAPVVYRPFERSILNCFSADGCAVTSSPGAFPLGRPNDFVFFLHKRYGDGDPFRLYSYVENDAPQFSADDAGVFSGFSLQEFLLAAEISASRGDLRALIWQGGEERGRALGLLQTHIREFFAQMESEGELFRLSQLLPSGANISLAIGELEQREGSAATNLWQSQQTYYQEFYCFLLNGNNPETASASSPLNCENF